MLLIGLIILFLFSVIGFLDVFLNSITLIDIDCRASLKSFLTLLQICYTKNNLYFTQFLLEPINTKTANGSCKTIWQRYGNWHSPPACLAANWAPYSSILTPPHNKI